LLAAQTVGDAVALGVRHYPAAGALVDVALASHPSGAVVELRPRLRDAQVVMFLVEEFLVSVLALFQRALDAPLPLQVLELAYPEPAHAHRYLQLFGVIPRFRCARNQFVLAAADLQRPMRGQHPVNFAHLQAQLARAAQQQALGTVEAVELLLLRAAPAALSITALAQALDLSPRTLRRRLEEAGTHLREIHDRVRAQRARHLLVEAGVSVADAAPQLGFTDVRAFRRACKRWWGQAPAVFRAAVHAGSAG
jgi:AraC-like DNA-binding protein